MVDVLRPDGSHDPELFRALCGGGYHAADRTIRPAAGFGYASRPWLLEHLNFGRRRYAEPYFDDDPADGYPQKACPYCHTAVVNLGTPACSRCTERFRFCKRCRRNLLYLDWDFYDPDRCERCLVLENGHCRRCERPALAGTERCHSHAGGDAVRMPKDRFWAPDFSIIEGCPVRPAIPL